MQRYKLKTGGKAVEVMFGWRKIVGKEGEAGRDYRALFQSDNGDLADWDQRVFAAEYERVEEKGEASIEHRFYCTQCYKDCDGLTEACHIAGRVGVVCPDCLSLHRDREAEVAAALHKQRARCEWERTHKGEWAKGPKDWWYRCADCNQPIPPSSDWLWKHGMCGSRICEACGKKRQAKKPKPVARVAWCMECGRKVKVGEGWFTFDHPGIWCQECGSKDEKPAPFGLCPGCNLEALPSQGTTYEGMTGKIWHTACVQKVQDKLKDEQKKSKPLTLADLKPGDVFRLVSHDFCQAKHQLLSAKEFWCSRDRKSITITHSEREVVLIAHHDLTPKQLLWIAATPEERKALDDSIREKWLPIMRGEKTGNARRDCFLCSLIGFDIRCHGCLLKRGNLGGCIGLGWEHAAEDARGCYPYPLARKFTMALASLLPNIDPLRIEVEATPVEWPGAKK